MDSDLKSRIEKLKQRRYPYQNSEGKWGYTDVFGKVVEQAHLDEKPENPDEPVKGARELDTNLPLTYREIINRYTDYPLGNKEKIEDEDIFFEKIGSYKRVNPNEIESEIIGEKGSEILMIRKDYGKVDINYQGYVAYGYRNKDGKELDECRFLNVYPFYEGMGKVRIDFDWDIKTILGRLEWGNPIDEKSVKDIEENLDSTWVHDNVYIEENSFYGFINSNGELAIPIKYSYASDFHEGLAAVCGKEWGYIDKNDNIVIPFKFDWAGDFQDGFARVLFAGLYYFIDKEGFCYESFDEVEYGLGNKFYLEDTELL